MSALGQKQTYAPQKRMSALPPLATSIAFFGTSALGQKPTFARQKNSWLEAALVHAGALLTNHIAPGRRTLAPLAYGASASRSEATTAETTSAGWLRSQLFTAPIWVD
jgi:hypothetical protein